MDGSSPIGDIDCTDCRDYPSHVLVPCQHKICFFHVTTPETKPPRHCVTCGQAVYAMHRAVSFTTPPPPPPPEPRALTHPTNIEIISPGSDTVQRGILTLNSEPIMAHRSQPSAWSDHSMIGPAHSSIVHGLALEDPFVDDPTATYSQRPNSLVEYIKSGAFADEDDPPFEDAPKHSVNYRGGPAPRPPRQEHVVQLWINSMVKAVPDADFVLNNVRPTFEAALSHQPFTLLCDWFPVSEAGVVTVKNIPYGATKSEIIAAIGRNSRINPQPKGTPFYAIHIIMERTTGKTMDCFVELESQTEAEAIVAAYKARVERNRAPRVGERHVAVELSSQEALMAQLFPKARCVHWQQQRPHIYAPREAYNSGFMGFVTNEEIAMIVKHAEHPQRSPFVSRALNRSYETMVSILWKYPWFATSNVSVAERNMLFRATLNLTKALTRNISTNLNPSQLTLNLLQEFLCAALSVPFSHTQKLDIATTAASAGYAAMVQSVGFVPLPNGTGAWWPFDVLDRTPGVSDNTLKVYAGLLWDAYPSPQSPFGDLRVAHPPDGKICMRNAAALEWEALRTAIMRALPRVQGLPKPFDSGPGAQQVAKPFNAAPGSHLPRKVSGPAAGNKTSMMRGRTQAVEGSSAVRERTGRDP